MSSMRRRKFTFGIKAETAFGTEASIASADLLESDSFNLKGGIEQKERNVVRDSLGTLAAVNGLRTSSGDVQAEIIGGGASDPTPKYSRVLESMFGRAGVLPAADAQTHGSSACTTTVIKLQAGDGAKFAVGDAIGIQVGGSNVYEVAFIESIATDDLTVFPEFSTAPGTGVTVKRAYTNKVSDDSGAYGTSYTLKGFYNGLVASGYNVSYLGCKGSNLAINLMTGEIIRFTGSFTGGDFKPYSLQDSSALAVSANSNQPIVGLKGKCYIGNTAVPIESLDIQIANTNENETSICADGGITDIITVGRMVSGTLKVRHDDHDILDAFSDTTKKKIFAQCGKTIGNSFAVYIKQAKFTDYTISDEELRSGEVPFTAEYVDGADEIYIAHL